MQFILNHLHTANGGTPNDCQCVIHSTFHGRLQSIVTCDKCNNRTVAVDPFLDLSLDLRAQAKKKLTGDGKAAEDPAVMRLEECLRRFTSDEKLPAAEYSCKKCNAQRDATKQFSILGLPPVLCIHLKVLNP
jgi:ubiquitin carboxyl-terminal hydrolase 22/27/51